jgi:hypothetical protein
MSNNPATAWHLIKRSGTHWLLKRLSFRLTIILTRRIAWELAQTRPMTVLGRNCQFALHALIIQSVLPKLASSIPLIPADDVELSIDPRCCR